MAQKNKYNNTYNKFNNTYHSTIKIKPANVKDNTYIDSDKESNNTDPKFKVGDYVKISKYKNIFAKGYIPNWSEEVSVFKEIKNTVPLYHGHALLMILMVKKLLDPFMKKNYKI